MPGWKRLHVEREEHTANTAGPSCSDRPPTQSVPLTKRCRGPPIRIRKNSKNGAEKRVFFRRRYCRPGAPAARLRRAEASFSRPVARFFPDPCVLIKSETRKNARPLKKKSPNRVSQFGGPGSHKVGARQKPGAVVRAVAWACFFGGVQGNGEPFLAAYCAAKFAFFR